jgi:hypothetical protein
MELAERPLSYHDIGYDLSTRPRYRKHDPVDNTEHYLSWSPLDQSVALTFPWDKEHRRQWVSLSRLESERILRELRLLLIPYADESWIDTHIHGCLLCTLRFILAPQIRCLSVPISIKQLKTAYSLPDEREARLKTVLELYDKVRDPAVPRHRYLRPNQPLQRKILIIISYSLRWTQSSTCLVQP